MSQITIPPALRSADLARFFNKASQLEKIRPVIAYWCEYWIVNQILAKGLHNGDPDTHQFTTALMDKLELIKAENPNNDAILDDTAGQIYVEQFAFEIFQRAEKAMKNNNVTKQTAVTFQAAATFFELIKIWSTPDAETLARIKYAKWNAVQILRAISQGKDPNIVNIKEDNDHSDFPKIQSSGEILESDGPMNHLPTDIEGDYEKINVPGSKVTTSLNYLAQSPSIVNVPEKSYAPYHSPSEELISATSITADSLDKVLNKSGAKEEGLSETQMYDSNFLEPKDGAISSDDNFSTEASHLSQTKPILQHNRSFESFPPPGLSENEPNTSQLPGCPTTLETVIPHPRYSVDSYHVLDHNQNTLATKEEAPERKSQNKLRIDDISIIEAQKHARWAISALNFEDSDTAVRELKEALKILGVE